MKPFAGSLFAILLGTLGLVFAESFDVHRADHSRVSPPVLPQILLPLLGAGGGVSVPTGFVQQGTGSWSSGTSYTVTMPSAPLNGDILLLSGQENRTNGLPPTISSVSSTNTTWTRDATSVFGQLDSSVNGQGELWHGVISGGPGGTTITVNLTATGTGDQANVSEWNNITTTLDGSAVTSICNSSCNITQTSGAFSTSLSNDLVFIVDANNRQPTGFSGAGYTQLAIVSSTLATVYLPNAPSGSQSTVSWTVGGVASTRCWGIITAAYEHM